MPHGEPRSAWLGPDGTSTLLGHPADPCNGQQLHMAPKPVWCGGGGWGVSHHQFQAFISPKMSPKLLRCERRRCWALPTPALPVLGPFGVASRSCLQSSGPGLRGQLLLSLCRAPETGFKLLGCGGSVPLWLGAAPRVGRLRACTT